jgi:hypothetical protein
MIKNKEFEDKHGKTIFSWEIEGIEKYERGVLWYVAAGLIGAALLVFSIWTANFLFAVIVLMFAVITIINEMKNQVYIECNIMENGIMLGKQHYHWKEMEDFWMVYQPPDVKTLYLELKGVRPRLSIPLNSQNPNKIREFLRKYVKEDLEREQEPISEYIGRVLKI